MQTRNEINDEEENRFGHVHKNKSLSTATEDWPELLLYMYTWQPCINECASGARFLINSSCTLSLRYQYSSELNLSLQAFFLLQKVFFFFFFTRKGKDLSRLSSTLAVEGFIPTCNGLSQALSLVLCKCPQLLVTSESILILWEHLDREGSDSKSNKLHEIIALHKKTEFAMWVTASLSLLQCWNQTLAFSPLFSISLNFALVWREGLSIYVYVNIYKATHSQLRRDAARLLALCWGTQQYFSLHYRLFPSTA